MSSERRIIHTGVLVAVVLSVFSLSCKQFDYVSPLPGILEIRLRAVAKDTTLQRFIPFAEPDSLGYVKNAFLILVKGLKVLRSDGSEQPIFSDLDAIRRNPDGDVFNCLDARARDSLLVLGKSYFPPSTVSNILLTVSPQPVRFSEMVEIRVTGQYAENFLGVRMPSVIPPELQQMSTFGSGPLNVRVEEGKLTIVTVTLDLDATLQIRTEWFEYHPTFYVTSIQQF